MSTKRWSRICQAIVTLCIIILISIILIAFILTLFNKIYGGNNSFDITASSCVYSGFAEWFS